MREYYVDYDLGSNCYGVFDNEEGFCHSLWGNQVDATIDCEERNETIDNNH